MIKVISLGSGSTGNAMLLGIEDVWILVDMGKPFRQLKEALFHYGLKLSDIKACFITHTHSDHACGYKVIHKHLKAPIFGSLETAVKMGSDVIDLTYEERIEIFNDFYVTIFTTCHDCDGSCGYCFEYKGIKIGYVTDLGKVTSLVESCLEGVNMVVVEANHDLDMLMQGPYPKVLKQRVKSDYGHLSNEDCASLCYRLARKGTKHFLLAHLSQENNMPEYAYSEVSNVLQGCECDVKVLLADRMPIILYD